MINDGFDYLTDINNLFDLTHVVIAYYHIWCVLNLGVVQWETRLTLTIVIMMVILQVLRLLKGFE